MSINGLALIAWGASRENAAGANEQNRDSKNKAPQGGEKQLDINRIAYYINQFAKWMAIPGALLGLGVGETFYFNSFQPILMMVIFIAPIAMILGAIITYTLTLFFIYGSIVMSVTLVFMSMTMLAVDVVCYLSGMEMVFWRAGLF